MTAVRRFLIAPSLSRLARRERGAARVTEGYFATQSGRNSHVLIEGGSCQLVLVAGGANGAIAEERTDVPRAHADALLDVCAGRAVYDRTRVALGGGRDVFVDHLSVPGPLDMISAEFDSESDAGGFAPPAWFGPEVTNDPAYDRRSLALDGLPAARERAILTDAALDSLLDTLEGVAPARPAAAPARASAESGVLDALRRFTTASAEAPAAAPAPAPAAEPLAAGPLPSAAQPEPPEPEDALQDWRAAVAAPSPEAPRRPEDARIDDVIAGLSQVLGGPSAAPEEAGDRRAAVVEVDRWVGRARRSEG